MHVHAVDDLPARAAIRLGGVRHGAEAGRLARIRDGAGGVDSGSGGRIHLGGMMQLDDLRGLEVRRGNLGEIIGQHGGNREVGRDEHGLIVTGSLGERRRDLGESLIGPTGGADHHVDPPLHKREHIVERNGRHGELHHDIGVLRRDPHQVITRVECEGELHVLRAVHRIHHMRSHAPFGADH